MQRVHHQARRRHRLHRGHPPAGALPLRGEHSAREREAPVNAPAREPILIVEDDASTAELERRSLARAGKKVRLAHGIAEAVACLAEERFAAVLLDYRLPEGIGWPVLEAARALVPRVPVII